jgi:hypothetical protein
MVIGLKETDSGTKKKVQQEIGKYSDAIGLQANQEIEAIWNKIYNEAIALCPVDTGSLVSTIRLSTDNSNMGGNIMESGAFGGKAAMMFNGVIIAGDSSVNPKNNNKTENYAALVHDGHVGANGSGWVMGVPFLTGALEKYENELMEAIQKATEKVGGE